MLPTADRRPPTNMRWILIDKFIDFESGKRAVAVKACTLGEDHNHDLYPDFPIMSHSLMVESMAQTAGMLVGEARGFKEKVILAKIGRATFHRVVRPGNVITLDATIDQLNDAGASITGIVRLVAQSPLAEVRDDKDSLVAEMEIMFSHIDNNLSGLQFPKDNFVFTESFLDLLRTYRNATTVEI